MITTTKIDYINIINETFTNKKIAFRRIECGDGILYLCETSYGQTFNLRIRNYQELKIWSFIGITSIGRAGVKYERKDENDSYPFCGIEITDDRDLSFYMKDLLAIDGSTAIDSIQNLITTYVNMLSHLLARCSEM